MLTSLRRLSTVVVVKAEGTLTVQTVGPEATDLNLALAKLSVGEQQPGAEDGLGQDVEDGVGNDLAINTNTAGAVGKSPDTVMVSSAGERGLSDVHGVGGPEDQSVASNGKEERGNLVALGLDGGAAVDGQVPDDKEVGNAGNRVPSPLGGGALGAESSEETGQDHDNVGEDGHGEVSTVHASKETKVKEQQRGRQGPVDVAGPEDLALDVVVRVRDVVVLLTDVDVVNGNTLAGGHGEVRDGGGDGDESRDDMEEALLLWGVSVRRSATASWQTYHRDLPRDAGEDGRRDEHDDEDDP